MATARRMRSAPAAKRGQQVREEQGHGYVSTQAKDRDGPYHENSREDTILTRRFKDGEHPAFVRFSAGLTINLGDFNSLRIDSGVTLPCLPDEIDETHIIASDWVAERIAEEEASWLGQNTKTPKAKRG